MPKIPLRMVVMPGTGARGWMVNARYWQDGNMRGDICGPREWGLFYRASIMAMPDLWRVTNRVFLPSQEPLGRRDTLSRQIRPHQSAWTCRTQDTSHCHRRAAATTRLCPPHRLSFC